jgi:hypothetical protein
VRLDALLRDVEAEHAGRVLGGGLRQLEAADVEAEAARLVEQQAVAAADVQQLPGGYVRSDQREQAARGGAPAGLFVQVRVVVHLAVERVQIFA